MDFGIAKPLAPGAFPQARDMTATGLQPMTLRFASPEQILVAVPASSIGPGVATGTEVSPGLHSCGPFVVVGLTIHSRSGASPQSDQMKPPALTRASMTISITSFASSSALAAKTVRPGTLLRAVRE